MLETRDNYVTLGRFIIYGKWGWHMKLCFVLELFYGIRVILLLYTMTINYNLKFIFSH